MGLTSSFAPHWLLRGGTFQSVAGIFWPQVRVPFGSSERFLVPIGEDGYLSIVQNVPSTWSPGKRIVLLVHGLTGSENSTHPVRLADAFVRRGILAIRMNMRGCGPGYGLAKGIYHSGRSEDTRAVMNWVISKYPTSPLTQIGISLGGNATLKMAGEIAANLPNQLDSVVAVSAPIDLKACSDRISQTKNRLFDFYFANHLVEHVKLQNRSFPDKVPALPIELLRGRLSLSKFDDLYVAPVSGFGSGSHYYEVCSARPLIGAIRCQTLLLTSEDDPIIPIEPYMNLPVNDRIHLIVTRHGGHAGFLSKKLDPEYGRFWMDRVIVDWVLSLPTPQFDLPGAR